MSTLSDEQIDAVKSEKTSEDTPKRKISFRFSRRTHRKRQKQVVMVRDVPQGRVETDSARKAMKMVRDAHRAMETDRHVHRMVTARDALRELARDVRRTETDRNARRVMEMKDPQNGNRQDRPITDIMVVTDSAKSKRTQETVRIRDRDARVMEEDRWRIPEPRKQKR